MRNQTKRASVKPRPIQRGWIRPSDATTETRGSAEAPISAGLNRPGIPGGSGVLELLGEVVDLAVELTGPDAGHGLLQAGPVRFGDVFAGHCPGEGGGGPVVALGDLGPIALLEDELLLGQQVVGVAHVELPDLVEQAELFVGVEAQVADQLADMGPVLLLDVGPVVLVARA